jgi:hypothetical protein
VPRTPAGGKPVPEGDDQTSGAGPARRCRSGQIRRERAATPSIHWLCPMAWRCPMARLCRSGQVGRARGATMSVRSPCPMVWRYRSGHRRCRPEARRAEPLAGADRRARHLAGERQAGRLSADRVPAP